MINCFILDDLPSQFKVLEVLIARHPALQLVGTSTNPGDFLQKYNDGKIDTDVLFLDIEMPGISGIELAQLLSPKLKVIFTTAHRQYAFDAFESQAVDYLLKPVHPNRFEKAIDKLIQIAANDLPKVDQFRFSNDHLVMKGTGKATWIKLKHDEIIYLKADLNYTDIFLQDRNITLYGTLKKIELMLPDYPFIRVHRQYVINFDHVANGLGKFITMSNDVKIPIGRIYAHKIKAMLNRP